MATKKLKLKRIDSFGDFAQKLALEICGGKENIESQLIVLKFKQRGFLSDDPRLRPIMNAVSKSATMTRLELAQLVRNNLEMFKKLFSSKLAIPQFHDFKQTIEGIFKDIKESACEGNVATYIPQIAKADPDKFGVSICTIDGQQLHLGDFQDEFTLQSCSKIINYAICLETHGAPIVHHYVGKEPSGVEFNAITLDRNKLPHNPCTNAGAIMTCSLIGRDTSEVDPDESKAEDSQNTSLLSSPSPSKRISAMLQLSSFVVDRFELVQQVWNKLFANMKIGFNAAVYLSEKVTGHRNYALGHFMMEQEPGFPWRTDLQGVMDFYFQCCSLEVTTQKLSFAAATLANGGINPLTGEYVFDPQTVRDCLCVMFMCGMYDYSGEFAFKVGIPSKSGVSGAIMSIVPNVMGMATLSPPLDAHGNSVRGVQFLTAISNSFNFHHFDCVRSPKLDPTQAFIHYNYHNHKACLTPCNSANTSLQQSDVNSSPSERDPQDNWNIADSQTQLRTFRILSYCAAGDLEALKRVHLAGQDLNVIDYDLRSPLHIAASFGHLDIVRYLHEEVLLDVDIDSLRDRWNGTPVDDAKREGHTHLVEYFKSQNIISAAALRNESNSGQTASD